MDQNKLKYNYPSAPYWSFLKEGFMPQETEEASIVPQYIFIDIHGPEIAAIREKVKDLLERLEQLEQRETKQVIPINFLETSKLKLKKPFNVVLEFYPKENIYIIDSLELNIYGSGVDELSALDDFKVALEGFYFSLKDDRQKLGSALKRKWEILNSIIKEK